jgi:hypothetical protein
MGNGYLELHDTSLLQGTVRTFYGENKMNVKILNHPIIYACKYWLQLYRLNNAHGIAIASDLEYIFKAAQQGLDNLKHTYRDDRDFHAYVNTYSNIISVAIATKDTKTSILDMLITLKLSEIAYLPPQDVSTTSTSAPSHASATNIKNNLYEELHKAWDVNKINTIIGLLKELPNATPFGKKNLYTAIDAYLMCIHEKTKNTTNIVFEKK